MYINLFDWCCLLKCARWYLVLDVTIRASVTLVWMDVFWKLMTSRHTKLTDGSHQLSAVGSLRMLNHLSSQIWLHDVTECDMFTSIYMLLCVCWLATHLLIFWTASHASHRRDLLHVVQSTMCVCLYVCVLGTPVSPAKTVEPIEMPFRRRLTCAQEIVNRSAAHWHHLMNTIKQSIRGGDATMRQITLTVSSSVEAVTQLR